MMDFIKKLFKSKAEKECDRMRALMDMLDKEFDESPMSDEERKEYEKKEQKLRAVTGVIYYKVVLELDGDLSDQEKVDDLYCKKICAELSDEDLQFILWGHQEKIVRRAPKTLDAIQQELTHRAIMGRK
jgi:hypothetical protein